LEAAHERTKHRQYLPDVVLYTVKPRPRPVIVAIARDVAAYAKARIQREVTRLMPGVFVTMDHKDNMGNYSFL